jgi:hypothetical protein
MEMHKRTMAGHGLEIKFSYRKGTYKKLPGNALHPPEKPLALNMSVALTIAIRSN